MAIIFDDPDEPEPVATYHIFTAGAGPATTGPTPTQAQWVAAISALNPGLPGSPAPKRGPWSYGGDEATLVPGKLRGYRCWAVRWPDWAKAPSPPWQVTPYTSAGPRVLPGPGPDGPDMRVGLRHKGYPWAASDLQLTGRVATDPWEPKPGAATCHREDLVRRHLWALGVGESATHPAGQPIPAQDCSCGWYAVHSPHDEELSTYGCPCPRCAPAALPVRGVVEGWGRVQLGPKGWRAERARVVALYLPSPAPTKWVSSGSDVVSGAVCPLAATAVAELARGLGSAYGVPVFPRWEELIAAFPPIDVPNLRVPEESKGTPGNE